MEKKKSKKKPYTLAAFAAFALFFYFYNRNPANQFINDTERFATSIKLPQSNITADNLTVSYAATSPRANAKIFSIRQKKVDDSNIFSGIDMNRLTGRLSELPVHRRIPIEESISYQLLWNGIHVADALLTTRQHPKNNNLTVLEAVINTNSVIQTIYPINDIIISEVESRSGNSIRYDKRENAGNHQKQEVIDIDLLKHKARYQKFKLGKQTRDVVYDVPQKIVDPLSVIYRVRGMNLAKFPKSITLNVLANKRVARAKLDQEKASFQTTPLGTFECYSLSLDMNYPGLFEEVPEGTAFAYIDKHSQVLVKVEASLHFGLITMTLVDWKKGKRPR